jgi:carbamoyl-phosphate synthase small subunit
VNQPVKNLQTGIVEITSHNHGFAVDPDGVARDAEASPRPTSGRAALSHWNLNRRHAGRAAMPRPAGLSVQYHPEAAPARTIRATCSTTSGHLMGETP